MTILSIRAGIALWAVKPGAVKTAKNYLLIFLAYNFVAAFLPFMSGFPESSNDAIAAEVLKNAFRSVVYFTIWYSYLNVSKRVNATYAISTNEHGTVRISENLNQSNEEILIEPVSTETSERIENENADRSTKQTENDSEWYKASSDDGTVTQIVLSFPTSSKKETSFGTIILPANNYPILSSNSWCAGFCRINNQNVIMLRAGTFAGKIRDFDLTVALSFCHMPSHPLFLVSVRKDNEELTPEIRARYPHVPPLSKPVAEWICGLNAYDKELISSVFESESLRIILAEDSLSTNHVYTPDGGVIVSAIPEAVCEYEIGIDSALQLELKEQWEKLLTHEKSIPGYKKDFQRAIGQEIMSAMPLDRDPIFKK